MADLGKKHAVAHSPSCCEASQNPGRHLRGEHDVASSRFQTKRETHGHKRIFVTSPCAQLCMHAHAQYVYMYIHIYIYIYIYILLHVATIITMIIDVEGCSNGVVSTLCARSSCYACFFVHNFHRVAAAVGQFCLCLSQSREKLGAAVFLASLLP